MKPEIVVDLAAVRHNVRALREHAGVATMTVVKADGYGHGMVEVARAAREARTDWLGDATIAEAHELRSHGVDGPLLSWLTVPGDDWAAAIDAGVDVSAYGLAELDEIAATGRPARVQLKIDTGLSRGGATAEDWPELVARARQGELDGSWRITGIWSHYAPSDEPDHPANDAQERAFRDALAVAEAAGLQPEVRHLANSAAGILRPSSRFDMVRFGIASYGLDPAPGHTPDLGLIPAMTVRAPLVAAKAIPAGAGVSYGHTWVAEAPTTVGLVPMGYGDGVLRSASNTGHVLVEGKQRPIRGRICMDQFVVDLGGDLPDRGTEVVVFGPGTHGEPTAQDWADAAGTISYEIVTRVGARIPRTYVDHDRTQPATTAVTA